MQKDYQILKTVAGIVMAHQERSQTSEDDLVNEFAIALGMDLNLSVSDAKARILECISILEQEQVAQTQAPWSRPLAWRTTLAGMR